MNRDRKRNSIEFDRIKIKREGCKKDDKNSQKKGVGAFLDLKLFGNPSVYY